MKTTRQRMKALKKAKKELLYKIKTLIEELSKEQDTLTNLQKDYEELKKSI